MIGTTIVAAPPARVMQAIHAVSAREIRFFRLLMAIRGLRPPGDRDRAGPLALPLLGLELEVMTQL